MGRHSAHNMLWGINLFAECPEKKTIAKLKQKTLPLLFLKKDAHVSRCSIIYAFEIVFTISSLVLWDEASYWSKYSKTINSSREGRPCPCERDAQAFAQTFVSKNGQNGSVGDPAGDF